MKTYTIYEAKTQLSKLSKRAAAGETIYIGAYGVPQLILTALPKKPLKRQLGIWDGGKTIDYDALASADTEIAAWLEADD